MDKEVKVLKTNSNDLVCQGDIFKNVKYYFSVKEDNDGVDITELTFPYVVILSQSCDTYFMSDLIEKSTTQNPATNNKFMYSFLVAPIYNLEALRTGDFFEDDSNIINMKKTEQLNSRDKSFAETDMHCRYYLFPSKDIFPLSAIDFKHYFTLNAETLMENRDNRLGKFDYEHTLKIVNKFASFLTRVGITDEEKDD